MSILIVDDNEDARYVLDAVLRHTGARVLMTESGKEALARLSRERVDVIVSDISMPGFSGHDFMRAVRRLPEHAHTPALALTGFDEPRQRAEAHEAGFHLYMVKPFDPAELIREIARLVGRSGRSPDAT